MEVIGVRFRSTKKIYYFSPNGLDIKKNDNVVVETSRGIEFGQTVIGIRNVPEDEIVQPLQKVIRIATPEDERTVENNLERQKDAFDKCLKKIEQHQLDMKLVDAEYTFDGSKLIFYFTSDGRVDFRELVKDLATLFRTRIELRQIAVRDETKILGGLGACGNEICCKKFLGDFASVSIKMAKEQNLSLNPTKISGLCGRLICCLNFEKDFYDEMNEKLPAHDETVMTPKGPAQVVATYPLKESVRVKVTNPDGSTDTTVFHIDDITRGDDAKRIIHEEEEGDNNDFIPDEESTGAVAKAKSRSKPYNKHNADGKKPHESKHENKHEKFDDRSHENKHDDPAEQQTHSPDEQINSSAEESVNHHPEEKRREHKPFNKKNKPHHDNQKDRSSADHNESNPPAEEKKHKPINKAPKDNPEGLETQTTDTQKPHNHKKGKPYHKPQQENEPKQENFKKNKHRSNRDKDGSKAEQPKNQE